MNLISCEVCGVVLNTNHIIRESVYDHDSGEVIRENASYHEDADEYMPIFKCPACKTKIFHHSGEIA